jgi:hypothetical protein
MSKCARNQYLVAVLGPRQNRATRMYSELVYFDGAHFAHIVAYHEFRRLRRLNAPSMAGNNQVIRGTPVYAVGRHAIGVIGDPFLSRVARTAGAADADQVRLTLVG